MPQRERVLLVIIAERNLKYKVTEAIEAVGAVMFNATYVKGSMQKNQLLRTLGLTVEQKKVLLTCLIERKNINDAFKTLNDKFKFDQPNTGIAFTLPLESISY